WATAVGRLPRGGGLVAPRGAFGWQGAPPTHPALLDWLAREFVDSGWSLKAMHRLMVTSATYRQSSRWNEANAAIDPDNLLLWRMKPRPPGGEALRAAMLAGTGPLHPPARRPSGPSRLPTRV